MNGLRLKILNFILKANKKNMKKILLLKSLESFYDMDYTGGIEPLNPLSLALTKKFLPKWSDGPLKTEIMNRFHCLPCLRLDLDAQCEQGSDIISALSLQVEEYDLVSTE